VIGGAGELYPALAIVIVERDPLTAIFKLIGVSRFFVGML